MIEAWTIREAAEEYAEHMFFNDDHDEDEVVTVRVSDLDGKIYEVDVDIEVEYNFSAGIPSEVKT